VANYRPVKRLDLLIEAFASIAAAHDRIRLLLVGEGDMRPELERQIDDLGLRNRVLLHGLALDPTPLYGIFDIVVQSSRSEGLPNALLEAAAAGLPIVATNAGGTGEIVTDGVTGLLIPINDARALASALDRVAADRELRLMLGGAARQLAATTFNMDRYVAEFAQLYEDLAARKNLSL
jgi:glycosyltransferase involved in cell wall biosynthesis